MNHRVARMKVGVVVAACATLMSMSGGASALLLGKVIKKIGSAAGDTAKAVGSAAKKAATTATKAVGDAAKAVGDAAKAVGDAAKAAFSATSLFGKEELAKLRKTAKARWPELSRGMADLAKGAKEAATRLKGSAKALAFIARASAIAKKVQKKAEPYLKAIKALFSDKVGRSRLQRVVKAIHEKRIDAQVKRDLAYLGARLGFTRKVAEVFSRREAPMMCSTTPKTGFDNVVMPWGVTVGISAGVIIGGEASGGFIVDPDKDEVGTIGVQGKSLGIQAEVSADICFHRWPTVDSAAGYGLGYGFAAKVAGGASFNIDFPSTKEAFKSMTLDITDPTISSFSACGGGGIGGSVFSFVWSKTGVSLSTTDETATEANQ